MSSVILQRYICPKCFSAVRSLLFFCLLSQFIRTVRDAPVMSRSEDGSIVPTTVNTHASTRSVDRESVASTPSESAARNFLASLVGAAKDGFLRRPISASRDSIERGVSRAPTPEFDINSPTYSRAAEYTPASPVYRVESDESDTASPALTLRSGRIRRRASDGETRRKKRHRHGSGRDTDSPTRWSSLGFGISSSEQNSRGRSRSTTRRSGRPSSERSASGGSRNERNRHRKRTVSELEPRATKPDTQHLTIGSRGGRTVEGKSAATASSEPTRFQIPLADGTTSTTQQNVSSASTGPKSIIAAYARFGDSSGRSSANSIQHDPAKQFYYTTYTDGLGSSVATNKSTHDAFVAALAQLKG